MPSLNWIGKQEAIRATDKIPYRIMEHDESLSYGAADNENLLIHGDNLDTLKALLPYYKGKVKCIYIDPPYNTQNAFEHYNDKLEHTIWLSLIYPRLKLLKKFLAPDGTIWISIDDDEGHYLKVICDEVFGRKNFINTIIWHKKHTRSNDARYLSDNHDFIICYSRHKPMWKRNLLPVTENGASTYKNPDNDPRGPWSSGPCHAKTPNPKDIYELKTPSGKSYWPPPGTSWRFSEARFQELIMDNRIYFGEHGRNVPRYKRFKTEVQNGFVPTTIWFKDEVGDNQKAKAEVKQFNQDDVFPTPKPERLIQRILQISTEEQDIVMDSFLGSGTTAAVAHKMKRRWIGIEMEDTIYSHCVPRLKQVVDGEQGGISKAESWNGGGGFRFYRLGDPIFTAEGSINPSVKFDTLASHIWFSETGKPWANKVKSPLLGMDRKTAYYLLFNGILGDKTVNGGNVLTMKILSQLPKYSGQKVIYGEASRIDESKLKALNIVFKQIPYNIKAR